MSQEQEAEKVDQLALNKVEAIKFMQEEIARYFGNNGYLLEQEQLQLKELCTLLHIEEADFKRLRDMAKSELDNFRRDDVLGLLLGRVDRSKFYFDAEKLSIRSSLADRWVEELRVMSSTDDGKVCKDEAKKNAKRKVILEWLNILDDEGSDEKSKDAAGIENNSIDDENAEKKRRDAICNDVNALLKLHGFLEEKDHVDNEKHFVCLIVYILLMILAVIGLNEWQFEDIQVLHGDESKYQTFFDSRDKKTYKSVVVGNVQWMAENLNYTTDSSVGSNLKAEGGRLYTWNEALEVCPAGWRLPTVGEWRRLISIAGGDSVAARVLKSKGLWEGNPGTDSLYFSALPAGYNTIAKSAVGEDAGNSSYWWTFSMQSDKEALIVKMGATSDSVEVSSASIFATKKNVNMYSVRCVKVADKVVPIRKSPIIDNSTYSLTIKGDVDGFRDFMTPVLKFPNGKKEQLYDAGLYDGMSGTSIISVPLTPVLDSKIQLLGKRPLFLQDANVTIKRMFERSLTRNNNAWVNDSIWIGDSVSVAGQYTLKNLTPVDREYCGADIDARLGQDTTLFILLDRPCGHYNAGDKYQVSMPFEIKVDRGCKDNCSTESIKLVLRSSMASAFPVSKMEE